MGAKSSSVPLGLRYIITTSQSLEFINITVSKNYKHLMSGLPQLRFIFKKGHLVWLGKQSHHTSLSLSKPQHPHPPLPWFLEEAAWWTKKLSWMDEASGWLWGPCRLLLLCDPMNRPTASHDFIFCGPLTDDIITILSLYWWFSSDLSVTLRSSKKGFFHYGYWVERHLENPYGSMFIAKTTTAKPVSQTK